MLRAMTTGVAAAKLSGFRPRLGRLAVKMATHGLLLVLVGSMQAGEAVSVGLAGRYVGTEKLGLVLFLEEGPDGLIAGTLQDSDKALIIDGQRTQAGFSGTMDPAGRKVPVTALLVRKKLLVLQVGPPDRRETIPFKREESAVDAPTKADAPAQAASPAKAAAPGVKRNVIINGQRLGDEEVARVEKTYQVRIADADYWYDRVTGAWGMRGGPTAGFILPGLELGGVLQPDASGGGTKVFINGRELHPLDLQALQKVTGPIMLGRYFITAKGLAGFENGPPLWDLAAIAAAQNKNDDPANIWSSKITGASGASDATGGAVFLPNGGGIVSYGQ